MGKSTLPKSLKVPEFEAKISYYEAENMMDGSVRDYYNKAIKNADELIKKATQANYMLESSEKQLHSARKTISDHARKVRNHRADNHDIKRQIASLRRENKNHLYFSRKRRDTNEKIKSLQRRLKDSHENDKEENYYYKKALRKVSKLKTTIAEKKKEIAEYTNKLEKLKDYRDKIISSTNKQALVLEKFKSVLNFSKKLNYNILLQNRPTMLALLQEFQKQYNKQPLKISMTSPITNATDLTTTYNQLFIVMPNPEKNFVKQIEQKRISKRDKYIKEYLKNTLSLPTIDDKTNDPTR